MASRPIERLLARLEPAELRFYRSEGDIVRFAQAEGYVQMSENRALLLVEEVTEPAQLDAAALRERVEQAQAAAQAAPEGSEEQARALRDQRRCEAFLAIAGGGGSH